MRSRCVFNRGQFAQELARDKADVIDSTLHVYVGRGEKENGSPWLLLRVWYLTPEVINAFVGDTSARPAGAAGLILDHVLALFEFAHDNGFRIQVDPFPWDREEAEL